MKTLRLQSPAKLNLFLKVRNKRADGYHNLVTLFERIDLCDTLQLTLRRHGRIRILCHHPDVPTGPKNLVYKVARLLKKNFSVKEGIDIKITKRIPLAAGLGGGSSNAAAVLLGLNKLWKLSLTKKDLLAYGRRIGSDVPFFLSDCRWAIGTQRGDKIRKLSLKVKLWHVLVVPKLKVYTREIFGAFYRQSTGPALSFSGLGAATDHASRQTKPPYTNILTKPGVGVNILHRALEKNDLPTIGGLLYNDLETTIVRSHPNLLKIKEKLKTLKTLGVTFSGSGPAVFALVRSKRLAQEARTVLKSHGQGVFVVRTF